MSLIGVNNVGSKISTRIRQAMFDPLNIEAFMYMGRKTTSLYARELKRAAWSQLSWIHLNGSGRENNEVYYPISGIAIGQTMDYLLAVSVEGLFPEITLVNTQAPTDYFGLFLPPTAPIPTTSTIINTGFRLNFYISDGTILPAGQIVIGSEDTLINNLGVSPDEVDDLQSFAPRHRVGWGQYAFLAAIDSAVFVVDSVDYEVLNRHALNNSLKFRMREDVYPVAGDEAVSFPAIFAAANVGVGDQVTLGGPEDERYKAFVVPFSFTTSALADRGENGKHKSAFPVMLACRNNIGVKVTQIDDLRKVLILEQEFLQDFSGRTVIFIGSLGELGVTTPGDPAVNNLFITDGTTVWQIPAAGFLPQGTSTYYLTSGTFSVITNPGTPGATTIVYSPTSPFTVSNLNAIYLIQTGVYLPLTRPPDYNLPNPFSVDFSYSDWIEETDPRVQITVRALGAIVTNLERGMMKQDCRSKKWLYERYTYFADIGIPPGDTVNIDLTATPGQLKYAYTFAENELSRLQGNWFNYTNDSDYTVVDDFSLNRTRILLDGKDSITHILSTILGSPDESHPSLWYRYVDNALFAQRLPREKGYHIAPRYENFINSINPDGSINPQATMPKVRVKTTPSGLVQLAISKFFDTPNTFAYNVNVIAVSWNIALFEFYTESKKC